MQPSRARFLGAVGRKVIPAPADQVMEKHPDIFTREEAAVYLHAKSVRSIETIEENFGLVGIVPFGKEKLFHRSELDRVTLKMFGLDPDAPAQQERRSSESNDASAAASPAAKTRPNSSGAKRQRLRL